MAVPNLFDEPAQPARSAMTEDEVDNPFGSTLPEGYRPPDEDEADDSLPRYGELYDKVESRGPKFNKNQHYAKAIEAVRALHPGMYFVVDYQEAIYKGPNVPPMLLERDLMGFADILGFAAPTAQGIAVQVTTLASMGPHLAKYTDVSKQHKRRPILNWIRDFFEAGGRFYILGFYKKEGSRFWSHELREVTPATIELYLSRKRKK